MSNSAGSTAALPLPEVRVSMPALHTLVASSLCLSLSLSPLLCALRSSALRRRSGAPLLCAVSSPLVAPRGSSVSRWHSARASMCHWSGGGGVQPPARSRGELDRSLKAARLPGFPSVAGINRKASAHLFPRLLLSPSLSLLLSLLCPPTHLCSSCPPLFLLSALGWSHAAHLCCAAAVVCARCALCAVQLPSWCEMSPCPKCFAAAPDMHGESPLPPVPCVCLLVSLVASLPPSLLVLPCCPSPSSPHSVSIRDLPWGLRR